MRATVWGIILWCMTHLASATDGVPAFRVLEPSGAESILIGSIHIPYPGLRQPAPSVMDGAVQLVVEHLTGNEEGDLSPTPKVMQALFSC